MQLDEELQAHIINHSQAAKNFDILWQTFVIMGHSRHIATYGNLAIYGKKG